MRTDAKITLVPVKLPHISVSKLLSFMTNEAAPGDTLVYSDGHYVKLARVIGRVDAPALNETAEISGWICAVVLFGAPFGFLAERWIKPEWVIECTNSSQANNDRNRLNWLLSDDWLKLPVDERRNCFETSPWFKPEPAGLNIIQAMQALQDGKAIRRAAPGWGEKPLQVLELDGHGKQIWLVIVNDKHRRSHCAYNLTMEEITATDWLAVDIPPG